MKASRTINSELSITLPYYIDFTIKRPETESDSNDRPLVFRWGPYSNAFAHAEVVLLHMTPQGPEKIDVPPLSYAKPDPDTIQVNGWNQYLWELQPGSEIDMREKLTANYQRLLQPGEKYELVWPGAELPMWDWGSMKEHVGKELRTTQQQDIEAKLPRLVMPASKDVITFTAKHESEPWPSRPKDDTEGAFQDASLKEADWRREEEKKRRNPPASPPPMKPDERV
jgi:hypothetical protein